MMNFLTVSVLVLATASMAPAQVDAPPARQETTPALRQVPMLDLLAETHTVSWAAIPLGDKRVVMARFAEYLGQEPEMADPAKEYRDDR